MERVLPSRFLSSQRGLLNTAGVGTLALAAVTAFAETMARFPLQDGLGARPVTTTLSCRAMQHE
jgi:hypothetical protein